MRRFGMRMLYGVILIVTGITIFAGCGGGKKEASKEVKRESTMVMEVVKVDPPPEDMGIISNNKKNLIDNGGFEEDYDKDGVSDLWVTGGTGTFQRAIYSGKSGAGKYGAVLTDTSKTDPFLIYQRMDNIEDSKGKTLTMTCLVRLETSRTATLQIADDNGADSISVTTPDWQRVSVKHNVAQDASFIKVSIFSTGLEAGFTGTVYVDDVVLYEGE